MKGVPGPILAVMLPAVLVVAFPAAAAFAAATGTVTGAAAAIAGSEPGYTLTSAVDWAAGTVEVEITRALDPSVPSLLKAKGNAETDIESRLPDFLMRAAGPVTVDSTSTFDDLLGADPGLHSRVSAIAQLAKRTAVFLSGDFSSLVERFAVPLYGAQGIARPLFPSRATPVHTLLGDVTTRKYTGLLIDARGVLPEAGKNGGTAVLQPAVFPRIWDEQMNLVMDRAMCDPGSLAQWGMVAYARGLDEDVVPLRTGELPLRLAARAVFGDRGTDVVISIDGARQLLALADNIALLRQGRVVIVYGPQP